MIDELKKISSKLESKIVFNKDIGKETWFRTGGKAKIFISVHNEKELDIFLNMLKNENFFVIGAGTNLLIRDKGYNGVILKLGKGFNKIEIINDYVKVGASILDSNLSKFAKINSIENFEFYSGIPGTIGGAVKMNAGCFGSETKDILTKVNLINSNGKNVEIPADNLHLKYRSSNLKDQDIVISALFKFNYGSAKLIDEKLKYIKNERNKKQPIKEKTSGSTFKNPPNHFAAELIEKSGCKGLEYGDAIVSDLHSNFLINKGRASAADIENLGKKIIEKVFNKFNILLDWEIKLVGE